MGKTPKPLKILVHLSMLDWPEVQALVDQGHTIDTHPGTLSLHDWDLILGPNCWRMDDNLRPFLPLAIKEARARAYPSK